MNALGKNSLPLYFTELLTEWAAKQLTNTFASSLSHLFVLFILGFLFDFQRRSNQFLRKFYAKLSPGLGEGMAYCITWYFSQIGRCIN